MNGSSRYHYVLAYFHCPSQSDSTWGDQRRASTSMCLWKWNGHIAKIHTNWRAKINRGRRLGKHLDFQSACRGKYVTNCPWIELGMTINLLNSHGHESFAWQFVCTYSFCWSHCGSLWTICSYFGPPLVVYPTFILPRTTLHQRVRLTERNTLGTAQLLYAMMGGYVPSQAGMGSMYCLGLSLLSLSYISGYVCTRRAPWKPLVL